MHSPTSQFDCRHTVTSVFICRLIEQLCEQKTELIVGVVADCVKYI